MFNSLIAKIICLIIFVMLVTAGAIIYITQRDVGQAISQAQEDSAQNILHSVALKIRLGYNQLVFSRVDAILERKRELLNLGEIGQTLLKEVQALTENGLISQEGARQKALEWIHTLTLGKKPYLFVFDKNGTILVHPNAELINSDINALKDMKDRRITGEIRESIRKYGGEYAVFEWKLTPDSPGKKEMGYFIDFPTWDWTLGAVIDIDDIESKSRQHKKKIIRILKQTFDKIHLAQTGHVFIFNGQKKIIIPPSTLFVTPDYFLAQNTLTGHPLLDDFMAAIHTHHSSMQYQLSQTKGERFIKAYLHYFKPLDWYTVVSVPTAEINQPAKQLVERQILSISVIFVISLFLFSFVIIRISQPLKLLANYARKLSAHDFTSKASLQSPIDDLPQKYKDEVGKLAESFVFMREALKKNIQTLMDTTKEVGRIQGELDVAHDIQIGILPTQFPLFSDFSDIQLYATMKPAKEVGGDLYDFFFLDAHHLCFSVGDVSNKGVPAALFMVITKTLIKTIARSGVSTAAVMRQINNILSIDNPKTMFVTLVIGIMNMRNGKVRYCNGGHDAPIVLSQEDGVYATSSSHNLVVGAMEDIEYDEFTHTLKPGESLFLYTDGVTEAMNAKNELFGEEALYQTLAGLKSESPETVIAQMLSKIAAHAGQVPQSDDITMLMIRYNGNGATTEP